MTYDDVVLLLLESLPPGEYWKVGCRRHHFLTVWGPTPKTPLATGVLIGILRQEFSLTPSVSPAQIQFIIKSATIVDKTFLNGELFDLSLEGAITQLAYRMENRSDETNPRELDNAPKSPA